MNWQKLVFIALFFLFSSHICFAQKTSLSKPSSTNDKTSTLASKSSPAFAEVLLRKTELTAELENLLVSYTDEYPKVKELRFESDLLQKMMLRLLAVNSSESSKLTLALGKLMVRKAELETNLWSLQKQYNDEHPEVKRAKRKVEIFDQAIKEILP